MYVTKLLMVIASLYLLEGYLTKSKIRFGCGLIYEYRGQSLHGLNKYNLLVGFDIPRSLLPNILISWNNIPNVEILLICQYYIGYVTIWYHSVQIIEVKKPISKEH